MKTPQFARRLIVQMYMTLLSILGASAILSPHARAQFAGGTGSVGDPYLVETADQLNAVRDHLTSHFLQVTSFDASAYTNWVPIGTSTQTFNGTYTGGSNTIENLTIDRPGEEYVGLFGYMAGSSWVKQLSLTNVSVVGSNSVGAVGGYSESNSESKDIHVWGSVMGHGDGVGGLFGRFNGTLSDCTADMSVEGRDAVAGMVGARMPYHASYTIQRCVMRGSVKGRNGVAGMAGDRGRGNNLINYADVEGENTVAGVLASTYDSTLNYAVNHGTVTASGNTVGGIAASMTTSGYGGSLNYCYNFGSVSGSNWVGGILGNTSIGLSYAYNWGSVTGHASVGGLIGYHYRSIYTPFIAINFGYNVGAVTGTTDVNAMLGARGRSGTYSPGTISRGYYDNQTSGAEDALAFGCSTAEMIQQVTFVDWDFDTLWSIGHEGRYTYPYFQWQGTNDIPYVDLTIPFATDVYVTGTDSVGETLTGHYTYHPSSAGDPEGATTFRWLRADEQAGPYIAITDATNQTYTLVAGDDNKWYQFEVTVQDVEANVGAPVIALLEFTSGIGTEDNPWQINNAIQLSRLANYSGAAHVDKHFLLTADIDLGVSPWNDGAGWTPIGSSGSGNAFEGKLNGRGHTISNLTVNRPTENYQGLFGYLGGNAIIALLNVADASVVGLRYVGGLCGYASGATILHCSISGDVEGMQDTGGLGGYTSANVYYSFSTASVTGGTSNVGGLLGAGAAFGSYWDMESSGQTTSGNGVGQMGKTTAEMQQQNTYMHWNFLTLWNIDEGNGYPAFQAIQTYSLPLPLAPDTLIGSGTADDPWLIHNMHELNAIRLARSNHYRLVNDIDLTHSVIWDYGRGWMPLGNSTSAERFTGGVDGAGHVVSHLAIARHTSDYQGFAGYTSGATIKNLGLVNVRVWGHSNAGGLAGYLNTSTLDQIFVTGKVTGQGASVGGIAGTVWDGDMHNVHSACDVRGYGNDTGGLVGYAPYPTIRRSSATGVVEGSNTVGGLVARISSGTSLTDCYSHSPVKGHNTVGGLVGEQLAHIVRSYSKGPVIGTGSNVGGAVGTYGSGTRDNLYWDMDTSGRTNSASGTGRNTAAMYQQATYENFNFNTLWRIDEGVDYPVFHDPIGQPQPDSVDLADLAGTGATNDPYIITNASELNAMRQDLAAHYRLDNDLDMFATGNWNLGLGWEPIGNNGARFTGSFDGAGHTISNLTVNRSGVAYQGLFGYTQNAVIRNLILGKVVMVSGDYAGALVGRAENTRMEDIRVFVDIRGENYTGGLAGYVGSGSVLDRLFAEGQIEGGNYTGGLIGYLTASSLHRSVGACTVEGTLYTGGAVGYSSAVSIYHSSSTGIVAGTGTVGGFVGWHVSGNIVDCYSRASVTNSGNNTGGFAGLTGSGTRSHGHIYRSFSVGNVQSAGSSVGGFQGAWARGTIHECSWDMNTSGQTNSVRGTGYSTEEMQQVATYRLHNFVTLWSIDEGNDYPVFQDLSGYAQPTDVGLGDLAGDGSEATPYLITNADELNAMRQDLTAHYRLANDIDLSASVIWNAGEGWAPVGSDSANRFSGSLDGAGHTLSNLTVSRPGANYQSLLGYMTGSMVSNVNLAQIHIYGSSYVGALAGMADGGSIMDTIHVTGIMGSQSSYAGGLLGYMNGGSLYRGVVDAVVDGKGNEVGGLIGYATGAATVQSSYTVGQVRGVNNVGGLVGNHRYATLTNGYSRMTVYGGTSVGGAVGYNGGGIGSYGYLYRIYSAGAVEGTGSGIGGLVGTYSRGTVNDSYWDMDASGQTNSVRGEGRSTLEMTYPHDTNTTYAGWDFVSTWSPDIATLNAGYPRILDPAERNLIYLASVGGAISGPTPQVVLAGQDGTQVEALPDEGAQFDHWSDGREDNPRTDTNITENLSVTAYFTCTSGTPIDWFDGHGITREPGEDWSDVDVRYDPAKRMTLGQQFIADLTPGDPASLFIVEHVSEGPGIHFHSSTGRLYMLQTTFDLVAGMWTNVPGAGPRMGVGGADNLSDTNTPPPGNLYRLRVHLP